MEKRVNWERIAARLFCILSLSVLMWAGFKYLGGILLPLSAALIASLFVDRCAAWLSKKTKLSKRLCATAILLLMLSAGVAVITFLAIRLYRELEGAVSRVMEDRAEIILSVTRLFDHLENILGKPEEGGISQYMSSLILSGANKVLSELLSGSTRLLSSLGGATPKIAMGSAVFVISTAYLSVDHDRIIGGALSIIPDRHLPMLKQAAEGLTEGVLQYIKAYVIIFVLTFVELLLGLFLLKVPYAWLLSFIISAVDILPLFGAGAVLLPWALISVIFKNYPLGLGLFALYGVILVVRQVAEPYIVGEKMGVHPLVSMTFMFVGFYMLGPLGVLLSPFLVVLFKQIRNFLKKQ